MSAERSHHPLGYSKLDKLNACLHFAGKPVGKAAKRGTDKHDLVEGHIKGTEVSFDPYIISAANRIKGYVPEILSVEEKLPLALDFEEVSYGYADYVGRDSAHGLVVVDLKTGSQPASSYRLQLTALAYAAMEVYGDTSCKCVLVYADSEDDFSFEVTRDEAEEEIKALWERISNKENEAPTENSYCGWCANKAHCPVFTKPIKSLVAMDEAAEIAAAGFSKEAILASPETASRFWGAYKKFVTLVEEWEVDGQMKAWIAEGKEVPGYKLQTRKGRQSVDSEAVLLKVVSKIGQAKASKFITISASSLQKEWASFTTEPLPVEIIDGEATVSLVAAKGGK